MTIHEVKGNLLDRKDAVQVCPINAMGAMGKGLALQMRKAYPGLFVAYRQLFHPDFSSVKNVYARATQLEVVHLAEVEVLLFCTKLHWRDPSPVELVDGNLGRLAKCWSSLGIKSLALPYIGTGEGGLERQLVRTLIYQHLDPIELPVYLYSGI